MIQTKNLTKKYGKKGVNEVKALDKFDLRVETGEVVALVGASGSGKSTFLNIMGGLDREYAGEVLVEDKDLKNYNPNYYRRHIVGTIFQRFYLIPTLSVAENIKLPLTFGKQLLGEEAEERLEYLLDRVGLSDRRGHKPSELSGGQAQRVAIARALIAKPRILLADEPTGNLDSKTGEEIVELILDLNKEENTTTIIVTHDPTISKNVKREIKLKDGKNVQNT